MNCEEFNECTEQMGKLENLLVKSGKITEIELNNNQMKLYTKYNCLKTETDQDNYVADYHLYLMNKMIKFGIGYDN